LISNPDIPVRENNPLTLPIKIGTGSEGGMIKEKHPLPPEV
jgi:hypothetical protein